MAINRPKPMEGFKKYFHRRRPSITEVVKEATAGGVVWRRNAKNGQIEVLLHKDPKDRWTIPKGHIEPGETPRQTAEREIKEETGLQEMTVMKWLGKINFQYRRQNSLILMTTHIYLVQAKGNTDKIKKEDFMKSIMWMEAHKAFEKIEYEDIGKLILLGLKEIRDAGL